MTLLCHFFLLVCYLLSCVRLFAALQAPLFMEFSRQKYWSRLPFPSPGYLPDPGIELETPKLQADSLPAEPPGNFLLCSFFLSCSIIKYMTILV